MLSAQKAALESARQPDKSAHDSGAAKHNGDSAGPENNGQVPQDACASPRDRQEAEVGGQAAEQSMAGAADTAAADQPEARPGSDANAQVSLGPPLHWDH